MVDVTSESWIGRTSEIGQVSGPFSPGVRSPHQGALLRLPVWRRLWSLRQYKDGGLGAATSMTLSASSANCSKPVPSGGDAKTVLTFGGRCWNNSLKKDPSIMPGQLPSNCCTRHNN